MVSEVVGMVSADVAARKAIVPDGFRATSWPTLALPRAAVATRVPLAPDAAWAWSAALAAAWLEPSASVSKRSVIEPGAVNVVSLDVPKKPTRRVLATVVVTEGAVTDVEAALVWPPDTSTGVVVSTPE